MPANLPPEARAKWLKVMEARSPEEKIRALEEFISAVPKHKGTENLLLWARRRLSQLREEVEEKKRKKAGGRGPRFFIEKEGAAQLVMLGVPNSGKSSLLARLTNAKPVIAEYPFSTREPVPGMLRYKDIQFQLVDTPGIPFDTGERVGWLGRTLGLARNADGIIIVLDMTRDPLAQLRGVVRELEAHGILIRKPKAQVRIEKTNRGGINIIVMGRLVDASLDDVKKLLNDYRIHHAIVRIWGEATLDDIEHAVIGTHSYKPALILANKIDVPRARRNYELLKKHGIDDYVRTLPVSANTGEGLDSVGESIFKLLDIIRVYTKQPNSDVAPNPLILRRGATVMDVAEHVHSRLAENFRYAKIWGRSAKYPGERVGPDHVVEDGDVVEIYARG